MKHPFSDFGKRIKVAVLERGVTQEWLIAQVREKTGLYFDSSYLNKIMIGTNGNEKIVSAIKEILSI